jgi:hypothetical protein
MSLLGEFVAVRAERLGRIETHWVDDDGWTVCGLKTRLLTIVDRLVLDGQLPADGCAKCSDVRARRPKTRSSAFSNPKPGRLLKTGWLNHGAKSSYGGQHLYDR